MKRILIGIFLILALYPRPGFTRDSCGVKISLLTCTPGSELYSIFGHSAIRVVDSAVGTDIVYNYGTFDFEDPDFYTKFVRGKLLYFVSREAYPNFAYGYGVERRGIEEQVLAISCKDKEGIQRFLENNIREENKYYKYDFLYDNCTTRLRDILEKYADSSGVIKTAEGMTFRNGIHYYLNKGGMHWSKFGIDLLLGARIDKTMTNREAMFLPEFLEESLDGSKAKGTGFVKQKQDLLQQETTVSSSFSLTPFTLFSVLALILILFSLLPSTFFLSFMRVVDQSLFFTVGALGCLFLFMWVGTDHKQTAENYNLIWAWPIHIFTAFILYSRRTWIKYYLKVYLVTLGLVLLLWAVLPQELNPALIPIIILLMFRSWTILKTHGDKKSTG